MEVPPFFHGWVCGTLPMLTVIFLGITHRRIEETDVWVRVTACHRTMDGK
jgi:hypothetical protein